MGRIDEAVDQQFKATKDGRTVFVPWKTFWPWASYRGYIIPQGMDYGTLRRGHALWWKIGRPAIFIGFLVSTVVSMRTSSLATVLLVFLVPPLLCALAHFVWLRVKCRGLARTVENY